MNSSHWFAPTVGKKSGNLFDDPDAAKYTPPPVTITCKPGDSLDHIEDGSIDVVVMGPALLRKRHVRRVVGLFLRLAQAHRRACPSPSYSGGI